MTITDKMVDKALQAFHYGCSVGAPDPLSMKDAINAVAPMLIAQELRDAARIVLTRHPASASTILLERAQELDPK